MKAHKKKANPLLTRNGKKRIKGMTIPQLTELLEKTPKPKHKHILNLRIQHLMVR